MSLTGRPGGFSVTRADQTGRRVGPTRRPVGSARVAWLSLQLFQSKQVNLQHVQTTADPQRWQRDAEGRVRKVYPILRGRLKVSEQMCQSY